MTLEDAPSGSTATGSQMGLADNENWKQEGEKTRRRSSSLSESQSSSSEGSRDR
jgi:hypothetical protein